jgi:diamine N-acetyltransferase
MSQERLTLRDKFGNAFEIGISRTQECEALLEMYRTFFPRPASQGLPPEDPQTCRDWVKMLFGTGINSLAWRGDRVIGHIALIPNGSSRSGELVVFVDQGERNRGVGTQLLRFSLEEYGRRDFELVWLTVRLLNFVAIKLYRRLGFEFCDTDGYERVMAVKVRPAGDPL